MKKELTNDSTLDLCAEVETLIVDVERTHRYSMGRIYGLYNRVFDKDEKPQSCASCLIRKVRELRIWVEAQKSEKVKTEKPKVKRPKRKPKSDEV